MTQHALISWCEDTKNILQHQIFSTCFYLLCYIIKMAGQMPNLPKCIPEGVLEGGLVRYQVLFHEKIRKPLIHDLRILLPFLRNRPTSPRSPLRLL